MPNVEGSALPANAGMRDDEPPATQPNTGVGGSSDEESEEPVSYTTIGRDHPVAPDAEEIVIHMRRVAEISGLEKCTGLKRLSLVSNCIQQLKGLDSQLELEELELYQNRIKKIENISHLKRLRILDLTFNKIREIAGIETLTRLEKLWLASNKIEKMEGLRSLVNLRVLELGSNRIREIEDIDCLNQLEELYLGKNKITQMKLPDLPKCTILSLQCNRLEEWDPSLWENLPELDGLYLSENKLPSPPEALTNLTKLVTLDLGRNIVRSLDVISKCTSLKELWLNDNQIQDLNEVQKLKALPNLETLYLERNPLYTALGPAYRNEVLRILPNLKQLDAILVNVKVEIVSHSPAATDKVPRPSMLKKK